MIEKTNDRVWIYSNLQKKYYPLAAGITHLKETYKCVTLETPNIQSAFCGREILYHTGQLEFEGFRVPDYALDTLFSSDLKIGSASFIDLVITNRHDLFAQGSNYCYGKKIEGALILENPGTGEGPIGSRIKGKILYTKTPEWVLFDETTQTFA